MSNYISFADLNQKTISILTSLIREVKKNKDIFWDEDVILLPEDNKVIAGSWGEPAYCRWEVPLTSELQEAVEESLKEKEVQKIKMQEQITRLDLVLERLKSLPSSVARYGRKYEIMVDRYHDLVVRWTDQRTLDNWVHNKVAISSTDLGRSEGWTDQAIVASVIEAIDNLRHERDKSDADSHREREKELDSSGRPVW